MGICGREGGEGSRERVESEGRRDRGGESEGRTRYDKGESLRMEQPSLCRPAFTPHSQHTHTHRALSLGTSGGETRVLMTWSYQREGALTKSAKSMAPPLKSMSGDKPRARWDLFKEPARVHEKERGGGKEEGAGGETRDRV